MAASIWRGRITFGLVSIPVKLVKAARRERTRFRRVQRVRAEDPATDDDFEDSEAPSPPPKVLKFPSATAEAVEHPLEEAVVRVRNAPVSGMTEAPVRPAE